MDIELDGLVGMAGVFLDSWFWIGLIIGVGIFLIWRRINLAIKCRRIREQFRDHP